jgi:hypothetical protein
VDDFSLVVYNLFLGDLGVNNGYCLLELGDINLNCLAASLDVQSNLLTLFFNLEI